MQHDHDSYRLKVDRQFRQRIIGLGLAIVLILAPAFTLSFFAPDRYWHLYYAVIMGAALAYWATFLWGIGQRGQVGVAALGGAAGAMLMASSVESTPIAWVLTAALAGLGVTYIGREIAA